MKTLELTAEVGPDRTVVVRLPADISPGPHRLVVVVDESPAPREAQGPGSGPPRPLNLPLLHVESWPADLSLRREDIYGDWGR